MRTNRRHFLQSAGVSAAAGLTMLGGPMPSVATAQPGSSSVKLRKDVAALDATSSDIVALKKAVGIMKGLPATDGRNWDRQAAIHGSLTGFGNCQHGSWHFLPWHRAYIFHFEQIVRTLSEDANFALPYWDWSRTHSLPDLFWGNNNPLHNSTRRVNQGDAFTATQLASFVGLTRVNQILNEDDFETFSGAAVDNVGDMAGQGELESGPHNFVHRWVGGDMVTGRSPTDPIFWLHHCNVDRLWSEWVRKHPSGTPNDAVWLDSDYANHFVDGEGDSVVHFKVEETLDTGALGYTYREDHPSIATPSDVGPTEALSFLNGAAEAMSAQTASFIFPTTAELRSRLTAVGRGEDPRVTVRVRLRGITVPKDQNVGLRVFINCQKLAAETPVTDPSFVGSVTFFGHGPGGDHPNHAHDTTFLLNVTQAFQRLYGDREFTEEEPLKVGVVATPLFPEEAEWSGSLQEIRPENVRFEVVRRGNLA